MIKKITTSLSLAIILGLLIVAIAWAGTVYDFGTLEGVPPVGEANWTAWITPLDPLPGYHPEEIMTEDSTGATPDLGYSDWFEEELIMIPEWAIQVENFRDDSNGREINMIFGGLGSNSGTLWFYKFIWDGINDSFTIHGEIPKSTSTGACPAISSMSFEGSSKIIQFSGEPLTKYYLYRSQNPAQPGATYSNGIYLYRADITTDSFGVGEFTDISELESWYIVIKAVDETSTMGLGGCHSEEAFPTAVTVAGFESAYNPQTRAIDLSWNTVNELDIMGFKILRSESWLGEKDILEQIAAENPGTLDGSSYAYSDAKVLFGETYFYWLELLKLDGSRETLGPVSETAGFQIFLPVTVR